MISFLTGSLGVIAAGVIVWLVRKDRLHVNHGFGWILAAIGFAFLGFAPELIDTLSKRLGIGYPPALGLTIAVIMIVIKILLMDIERSRLEVRNERLAQRLAILETDLINATVLKRNQTKVVGDNARNGDSEEKE